MAEAESPRRPASPTAALDRVLTGPRGARAAAVEALEQVGDEPAARADALWSLGKAALEDNRITDAVTLLELAADESSFDPVGRARIQCTLGVALGQDGRPIDAATVLDEAEPLLQGADLARLRNQRGMLMVDAGRLPEARGELVAAADELRRAGDTAAEARTLCNLGVVTSLMGHLDEAEEWFEKGRDLAEATDQHLVVAGTEGNLGYVAGRRGDFPTALRWYEAARRAYGNLGEVGRSAAILESDFARTLIDAGLAADAVDAAQRSLESAESGHNRTLAAQSRLLLAEALIEVGRLPEAGRHLERSRVHFNETGATAWALQADHLSIRASADADDTATMRHIAAIASALDEAGWRKEAVQAAIALGEAGLRADEPALTRELIEPFAHRPARERGARRADLHHLHALLRLANGDPRGAKTALRAGLRALEDQYALMVSVELQAGVAARGEALARLGTELALADGSAGDVLRWADRWRGQTIRPSTTATIHAAQEAELVDALRAAVAAVETARLGGGDISRLDADVRHRENELRMARLRAERGAPADRRDPLLDPAALRRAVGEATLVHFVVGARRLAAVVVTSTRSRLVDLGAVADVVELAARQAESLRRMSRARSARIADAAVTELDETGAALDSMLLGPLRLGDSGTVIVVPTGILHTVAWAACGSLRPRPFLVAPSARMWLRDHPRTRRADGVALLGGPGLTHTADELRELETIHAADTPLVDPEATVATAVDAFERHALVHVAAHGEFRADNALFSTLRLTDGPLNLFDIERLTSVPDVVVLAACDAGAAAHSGNELIGTTAALLRMGVRNVVAPTVEVSDEAEARFMADFHRSLVDGLVPSEALVIARQAAFGRRTPIDIAAGAATAAFGTCIDPGLRFAATR